MMRADHRRLPFTISVDKNAAYPEAFITSQREKVLPHDCKLRRVKYLNNIIEQDHRFIKNGTDKSKASTKAQSYFTGKAKTSCSPGGLSERSERVIFECRK
jgi:transposase-like protein